METPSTSIASRLPASNLSVSFFSTAFAFAGLALGIAASRLLRTLLYGTAPLDAPVFFSVIAILLAVACAACLISAWHVSRLDPLAALRTE
jgi:ABC-type antimicrobial peptide transport system permease subunit